MAGKNLLVIIVFVLLMIPSVYSIGIGFSGERFRYFVPDEEFQLQFSVINTVNRDMYIELGVGGDLQPYSFIESNNVFFKAGESKPITVTVKLPDNIEKPGSNRLSLRAIESPPSGATINARAAASLGYTVFVPYPGKYLETKLVVPNVKESEPIYVDLDIINRGQDDLDTVYFNFSVLDYENNVLLSNKSYPISIKSEESTTIRASLDNTLKPATYTVKSMTHFDGEHINDSTNFIVGALRINILNFTRRMDSGSIEKFVIEAGSEWNDPINNVYGVITIINLTGNKIDEIRTRGYDFKSFETIELESFIDTSDLPPGEYVVDVALYYVGETTSEKATLLIVKGVSEGKPFNISFDFINTTNVIVTLLILVIILLVVIDYVILKKKGDKR